LDADNNVMKQKQEELQAALERLRDLAENWFHMSGEEKDRLRDEWRDPALGRSFATGCGSREVKT
jgi:hypothetical protein